MIKSKISLLNLKIGIKWSMPFNWNVLSIKSQNIFVHEEIKFPKSFSEFSNSSIFNGTVNGQPLVGRSLAIDPLLRKRH